MQQIQTQTRMSVLQKSDLQADTSVLEAEIDRLVCELYGLTEEEIAIAEGSMNQQIVWRKG